MKFKLFMDNFPRVIRYDRGVLRDHTSSVRKHASHFSGTHSRILSKLDSIEIILSIKVLDVARNNSTYYLGQ